MTAKVRINSSLNFSCLDLLVVFTGNIQRNLHARAKSHSFHWRRRQTDQGSGCTEIQTGILMSTQTERQTDRQLLHCNNLKMNKTIMERALKPSALRSERGNKRPLENSWNHTVIHVCVAVGFPSLIFSFRLELTRSPLHEAVAHGHAHVTERLLEVSKNNFHRYAWFRWEYLNVRWNKLKQKVRLSSNLYMYWLDWVFVYI